MSPTSNLLGAAAPRQLHQAVLSSSGADHASGKPAEAASNSIVLSGTQPNHNVSVLTLQNLQSTPWATCSPTIRPEPEQQSQGHQNKNDPRKRMPGMPGVFYQLISELLGEKLPLIIFTNRQSFKVSLDTMISCYANCQEQIVEHKELLQRELQSLRRSACEGQGTYLQKTASLRASTGDGVDVDRYQIATIPEEEGDPQPSNSQHDSPTLEAEPASSSPQEQGQYHKRQQSTGLPDFGEDQLDAELLEIVQVEKVYSGIIENIRLFRHIVA